MFENAIYRSEVVPVLTMCLYESCSYRLPNGCITCLGWVGGGGWGVGVGGGVGWSGGIFRTGDERNMLFCLPPYSSSSLWMT